MNSNRKGKVGERELSKILREHGYECRRSQQYAGGVEESADIIGLPHIHIECKRVESLNIDKALEQAEKDLIMQHYPKNGDENFVNKIAKALQDSFTVMPTVFHRKNGKQWKVTMYLDDWIKLYKEFESGKRLEASK